MIIVLSPAKTLDLSPTQVRPYTLPRQLEKSQELVATVRQLGVEELASLMQISKALGELNWQRYRSFQQPFTPANAKQALLVFKGDVYRGIGAYDYSAEDFSFAQQQLRILSGLYGVLRPLDLIQPYRLEMGVRLKNQQGKNLYDYWGTQITELINQDLTKGSPLLINLASREYFKAIKPRLLKAPILTLSFKQNKGGEYKTIGIHAKLARGLMARFIIKHRLTEPDKIKAFSDAGYRFNEALSSTAEWIFSRE